MAGIGINRLGGGSLYADGNTLLGKVEEMQLPGIKVKTSDVKALGMIMEIKLPSGGFEAMTGKIKFNAVYPELIERFGNVTQARKIQYRCSLETHDSSGLVSEVPLVAFLTIRFNDVLPSISVKQHDNPEQECDYFCTYYRLEVDGKRMVEIDAFTNTYFVKEKDVLLQYRSNLGF